MLKVASDSMQLIYNVMEELENPCRVQQSMLNCIGMCKFRSMEKRLIRLLIRGIVRVKVCKDMITADVRKCDPGQGDSGSKSGDGEYASRSSDGEHENTQNVKRKRGFQIGLTNKRMKTGNVQRMLHRAAHDWHHSI